MPAWGGGGRRVGWWGGDADLPRLRHGTDGEGDRMGKVTNLPIEKLDASRQIE